MRNIFLLTIGLFLFHNGTLASEYNLHAKGKKYFEHNGLQVYLFEKRVRNSEYPSRFCPHGFSVVVPEVLHSDFEITQDVLKELAEKLIPIARATDCEASNQIALRFYFEGVYFVRDGRMEIGTEEETLGGRMEQVPFNAGVKLSGNEIADYNGQPHIFINRNFGYTKIDDNLPLNLDTFKQLAIANKDKRLGYKRNVEVARAKRQQQELDILGAPLNTFVDSKNPNDRWVLSVLSALFLSDRPENYFQKPKKLEPKSDYFWPEAHHRLRTATWSYIFLTENVCSDSVPNGVVGYVVTTSNPETHEVERETRGKIPQDLYEFAATAINRYGEGIDDVQRQYKRSAYYRALAGIFSHAQCSKKTVSTYHNNLIRALNQTYDAGQPSKQALDTLQKMFPGTLFDDLEVR